MIHKSLVLFVLAFAVLLSGCGTAGEQAVREEARQQGAGVLAIVQNQPVPDLGGWSFEREVVIQTTLARNRTVATYTYLMTLDGKIIEICASIGYPIPYSTQITNPEQAVYTSLSLPQPEPNSLYSPENAEATYVQCSNSDGTVAPVYMEPRVFALPYRIQSDMQFVRLDALSSVSVSTLPHP